jgi:hypothetical protein
VGSKLVVYFDGVVVSQMYHAMTGTYPGAEGNSPLFHHGCAGMANPDRRACRAADWASRTWSEDRVVPCHQGRGGPWDMMLCCAGSSVEGWLGRCHRLTVRARGELRVPCQVVG